MISQMLYDLFYNFDFVLRTIDITEGFYIVQASKAYIELVSVLTLNHKQRTEHSGFSNYTLNNVKH